MRDLSIEILQSIIPISDIEKEIIKDLTYTIEDPEEIDMTIQSIFEDIEEEPSAYPYTQKDLIETLLKWDISPYYPSLYQIRNPQ